MQWLNIETKLRTSPEFIGSDPTQRATWLCLMMYCAEHENGGVIKDCLEWGDRRWMQTCGVTKKEIESDCALFCVKKNSLVLWGYPKNKEKEVRERRNAGKRGGINSGQQRRAKREQAELQAEVQAPLQHNDEANDERKGKERKGRGKGRGIGKEELATLAARVSSDPEVCRVLGCRDEFRKCSPEAIAKIIHDFRNEPDFDRNLDEFVLDAANSLEVIRKPTAMLRAYLARVPKQQHGRIPVADTRRSSL